MNQNYNLGLFKAFMFNIHWPHGWFNGLNKDFFINNIINIFAQQFNSFWAFSSSTFFEE